MMLTPSQVNRLDYIKKSTKDSKWSVKRIDTKTDDNAYVVVEANEDCVYLHESVILFIGKRGRLEIIGASVFCADDGSVRHELEKTAAALFCYDVYGYGKHPKIKIKKY